LGLEFRIQGLGIRDWDLRCRVSSSKFYSSRIQGSGFRIQGSGFRVQGSGLRVKGSEFRV
jgi:hypothetical protein